MTIKLTWKGEIETGGGRRTRVQPSAHQHLYEYQNSGDDSLDWLVVIYNIVDVDREYKKRRSHFTKEG